MTQNTKGAGASLSDDLNPEIVQATATFIGKITGLVPPPHDAFPPEWYGHLRTFTKRVYEVAGLNAKPSAQASGTSGDLHEAARQFHNLTQGDSTVIIRAPSAEKRDAIIAAGERLRAALAPTAEQAEGVRVQYWLVELDQHGNPTLIDGSHSERAGADKAAYLMGALKLSKGRTFSVARIELSDAKPSPVGINHEAVSQCRHMMAPPASSTGDQV